MNNSRGIRGEKEKMGDKDIWRGIKENGNKRKAISEVEKRDGV